MQKISKSTAIQIAALMAVLAIGIVIGKCGFHHTYDIHVTESSAEAIEASGIYADCGVILEKPGDTVAVTFQNGNVFEFFNNDHDWFIGDLVTVTFYDNGTEEVKDDVILKVRYSGWIEGEELATWIK